MEMLMFAYIKTNNETIRVYADHEDFQVVFPNGSERWFSIHRGDKKQSFLRVIEIFGWKNDEVHILYS